MALDRNMKLKTLSHLDFHFVKSSFQLFDRTGHEFLPAVTILSRWLAEYNRELGQPSRSQASST
jgi:hypothetical protein